jgi:hypothetical protein
VLGRRSAAGRVDEEQAKRVKHLECTPGHKQMEIEILKTFLGRKLLHGALPGTIIARAWHRRGVGGAYADDPPFESVLPEEASRQSHRPEWE